MSTLAKINSKGQITVPADVREVLGVKPGDTVLWELAERGEARVRRAAPLDIAYLETLEPSSSEWASEADEAAHREL